MAERTLEPDRLQTALVIEESLHADDRVQFEQHERRPWIVEVHLPIVDRLLRRVGQRVSVDLQADRQCGLRAHAGADAAVCLAGDRLVQLERVTPERLTPERVVSKDLPALLDHLLRMMFDETIWIR